jgi:anti-sigma factor RsiW
MNRYDCETMRDVLPAFVRGELLPLARSAARQHLDACDECRAEADVVIMIQSTLDPVPDGLEARVLQAVRAVPTESMAHAAPAARAIPAAHAWGALTRPGRTVATAKRWAAVRIAPARLAMAATLAAAVLGGSLVVERFGAPWARDAASVDAEWGPGSLLSWVAMDDDLMLHSGVALQELSVEELELLLEELES